MRACKTSFGIARSNIWTVGPFFLLSLDLRKLEVSKSWSTLHILSLPWNSVSQSKLAGYTALAKNMHEWMHAENWATKLKTFHIQACMLLSGYEWLNMSLVVHKKVKNNLGDQMSPSNYNNRFPARSFESVRYSKISKE